MEKIGPYETALTNMGGDEIALEAIPPGDKRTRIVKKVFDTFSDVMGHEREGREIGVDMIVSHLQEVLGIEQLSRLRKKVILEAIE